MNTNIKKAIKLAVEGGWKPKDLKTNRRALSWVKQAAVNRSKFAERYFLDPLFWQALGKSLGKGLRAIIDISGDPLSRYEFWWQYQWHRLIDFLAEGKSSEDYFRELLK